MHIFSIGEIEMSYMYSIGSSTFSLGDKINSIDQYEN